MCWRRHLPLLLIANYHHYKTPEIQNLIHCHPARTHKWTKPTQTKQNTEIKFQNRKSLAIIILNWDSLQETVKCQLLDSTKQIGIDHSLTLATINWLQLWPIILYWARLSLAIINDCCVFFLYFFMSRRWCYSLWLLLLLPLLPLLCSIAYCYDFNNPYMIIWMTITACCVLHTQRRWTIKISSFWSLLLGIGAFVLCVCVRECLLYVWFVFAVNRSQFHASLRAAFNRHQTMDSAE